MHALEKIDYSNASIKAITVGKAVNRVRKEAYMILTVAVYKYQELNI